jgi:hypothetical protein
MENGITGPVAARAVERLRILVPLRGSDRLRGNDVHGYGNRLQCNFGRLPADDNIF